MRFESRVDHVVAEVDEFMGAGRVGLYEFIEIQRSDFKDLSEGEMVEVALAALHRLIELKMVDMRWLIWADADYDRPASSNEVSPETWQTPTDRPYLAVVPRGPIRPYEEIVRA